MDLNKIVAFVAGNPYMMWATGLITANRLLIIHYLGLAITKIPLLRRIFLGHPDEVLATLDALRAEVQADKDEAAAIKTSKAQ